MSRFTRFSLFFAAAAVILPIILFTSSRVSSNAVGPDVWLTVDSREFGALSAKVININGEIELIETRGEISIVHTDEAGVEALTAAMHNAFHKCAGFVRHSTLEEARRAADDHSLARSDLQLVEYTIDNQAAVVPMLAASVENEIRQTILDLSALPNRRHNQQGGLDGANWIRNRWATLAQGRADMAVTNYEHRNTSGTLLTPQPSVILTITGTQYPNEIVVVGGHQDSINTAGATAAAPGADDDASGIASITEVIRVIRLTGFRPKRTIQFMAYAAEEVGLVGSRNIAENYRLENRNVIGVLQLDMTNFKGATADIAMITDNTNAAQNQFIRNLITMYQPLLVVVDSVCGYGCSDHYWWHNRQYAASMPFEAKYPSEYNTAIHTANDTIARSNGNANHALKFTKLGLSFIGELAKGDLVPTTPVRTRFDYDGDGRSDVSVFRASDAVWHLNLSTAGYSALTFGLSADRPVPADFDGDGKTDIAVYRGGVWHMLGSQAGYSAISWGLADDIPQPGDFDGDGKADVAVFRPSNGAWYILRSSGGFLIFSFGQDGDRPIAADFDGDARTDAAVYRSGTWYILGTSTGYGQFPFGLPSDQPVIGDFDGDRKNDPAVFRGGLWYVLRSTGGISIYQWGMNGDVPTAADFDGDGRTDAAVFRSGIWYVLNSSNGAFRIESFGYPTDAPTQGTFNN